MALFLFFLVISLLFICLSLLVWHLSVWVSLLISLGIFLLLHLLYALFFGLVSLSMPKGKALEKQNALICYGAAEMASLLLFYGRVRPFLTGTERMPKDGRFLFVCNHRSIFDPMIVMDKMRNYHIAFISKPENMNIPVIGRCLYSIGYLSIDRENDRNALKTILTAADYMKRDVCSIGIYPEGTRSKTEELLPFHAGSLKAAQRAKVPIVVACVRGTENAQTVNFFSRRKDVFLDILEVIPADTVCSRRTEELSDQIRSLIQEDLDRAKAQEA